jgi:hypothetical protein
MVLRSSNPAASARRLGSYMAQMDQWASNRGPTPTVIELSFLSRALTSLERRATCPPDQP